MQGGLPFLILYFALHFGLHYGDIGFTGEEGLGWDFSPLKMHIPGTSSCGLPVFKTF